MVPSGCAWGCWPPSSPRSRSWRRADQSGRPVRGEIVDRQGRLLAGEPAGLVALRPPAGNQGPGYGRRCAGRDLPRPRPRRRCCACSPASAASSGSSGRSRRAKSRRCTISACPASSSAIARCASIRPARPPRMSSAASGPSARACAFAELVGSGGVEGQFDARLRDPALAGEPLRLSLDLAVQEVVRQELAARHRADDGQGRHGDPDEGAHRRDRRRWSRCRTSIRTRRRSRFAASRGQNPRFNRAAQGRYELGSTFKVLTAAMALDTGVANAETLIETPPIAALRPAQRSATSTACRPMMPVEDVVVEFVECRRGAAGADGRHAALQGVSAPSSASWTRAGSSWSRPSTTTRSMPRALDGSLDHHDLVRPRARGLARAPCRRLCDDRQWRASASIPRCWPAGAARASGSSRRRRAREMLRIMRQVVVRGTATRADVPGYEIGGKTGTADKVRPNGGYYHDRNISTFAVDLPDLAPAIRAGRLARRADRPLGPLPGAHRRAHRRAGRRRHRPPCRARCWGCGPCRPPRRAISPVSRAAGASECLSGRSRAWG